MLIFIAWDGDHIGRQVGRASRNDDVEGLRRISQAIDQGNNIWRSWVESTGGSLISMGGDEGRAEVAADHIGELPAIREQYAGKVGSTVSVGVGMKLSEAEKALIAAKLKGEDQIVFFSDECDELIARARAKGEQTEEDKIADQYLGKAAPAMNQGDGAGFAGATRPSAPTVDAPVATQGDSDEMASLNAVLGDENAPAPPEQTHAAKDFERQLHDEAWKGEEEDMSSDADKAQRLDQVKAQVVQALQTLKVQAPMMEQLKQVAPQAYQAMVALTQSVVGMARELAPAPQGAPMAKSEAGKKDKADKTVDSIREAMGDDIYSPQNRGGKHCLQGHCYVAAEALHHLLGGKEGGWTPHAVMHDNAPHWYLKHQGGRVLDPTSFMFDKPVPYAQGQARSFMSELPSERTRAVIDKMIGNSKLKPEQGAEIKGDAPLAKAGKNPKAALKPPTAGQREELVHYSVKPGLKQIDVNRMGTGAPAAEYKQGKPAVGRAYYYRAGSAPEPLVTQGAKAAYSASLDPTHRLYDLGLDPDGLSGPSRERFLAGEGLDSPEDTLLDNVKSKGYYGYHNSKSALPHVVALFHPHPVREMKKEEMVAKAGLPMPGAPAHSHLNLPAGSTLNGKIKVQHSDGTQSWKQVQAGMITSQDPSHHPTSSRNPDSK